ncbi:terminase small subunit [Flavobacterium kingsejongi]|uniref:Terminase small subunit n=1 Tax=Flavobacterium kingsejongi TaxID=1678728 RepID=A0A2S1LQT5_9FLAO|nr:terminase small subunit [Flavobacterium kingsejongi]AWG26006.1 hypothetical protein FK004_12620 [Flavobacterium kingsejongi]
MIQCLTIKQENYCQAYVRLGNKSVAYREAYSASKMKPETVNRAAFELHENPNITARIKEIQHDLYKRNQMSIDECISILSDIARFDIVDIYDESGNLKKIQEIPKSARNSIEQIESFEEFEGRGIERKSTGINRKIKTSDKQAAIDKLIRYMGGYNKDNEQKQTNITLFEIPKNGRD